MRDNVQHHCSYWYRDAMGHQGRIVQLFSRHRCTFSWSEHIWKASLCTEVCTTSYDRHLRAVKSFQRTGLSYVTNRAQFPKCPRSAHCQSWQHPGFFQTRAAAVPEFAKTSHDNRKLHNAIPERKSFILQLLDNERAYTTWRTTRRKTIFPDVRTCDQNLMVS